MYRWWVVQVVIVSEQRRHHQRVQHQTPPPIRGSVSLPSSRHQLALLPLLRLPIWVDSSHTTHFIHTVIDLP